MWYWELMSNSSVNYIEQDGHCNTIEECFKSIGDNTWRLYTDDGFAHISLFGSSHSFVFPVVKRNI